MSGLYEGPADKLLSVNESSLANDRPQIESVFGPLTETEDHDLREELATVDRELLGLAAHFGHNRTRGLYLRWARSGQVSITGYVDTSDEGSNGVEFYLEIRPAWFYGHRTGEPGWDIEASVYADCQHEPYHGGMDTVWDRAEVRLATPHAAVRELVDAARELRKAGEVHPVSHWIEVAGN